MCKFMSSCVCPPMNTMWHIQLGRSPERKRLQAKLMRFNAFRHTNLIPYLNHHHYFVGGETRLYITLGWGIWIPIPRPVLNFFQDRNSHTILRVLTPICNKVYVLGRCWQRCWKSLVSTLGLTLLTQVLNSGVEPVSRPMIFQWLIKLELKLP